MYDIMLLDTRMIALSFWIIETGCLAEIYGEFLCNSEGDARSRQVMEEDVTFLSLTRKTVQEEKRHP
jgi:hypothetical protein